MTVENSSRYKGDTVLQARIKARLSDLRRSARDVSLKAGLGPDAIRTILAGRSRSPRGETLAALARELHCDVAYLMGGVDRPWPTDIVEERPDGALVGAWPMNLTGELSLAWDRFGAIGLGEHVYQKTNIFSLPDFDPIKQGVFLMSDDSMGQVVQRGSYIHTLELADEDERRMNDRDLVVVRRVQSMPHDVFAYREQVSLRRVRLLREGVVIFETLPSNPVLFDEIKLVGAERRSELGYHIQGPGTDAVQVMALALRSLTVLTGPRVETEIITVNSARAD